MVLRNPNIAKSLVFNIMENKLRILDSGIECYEVYGICRSVHQTSICCLIIIIFGVRKQTLFWHSCLGEHLYLHISTYTLILLLCKLVSSSHNWLIISYFINYGESYVVGLYSPTPNHSHAPGLPHFLWPSWKTVNFRHQNWEHTVMKY